MDYFVDGSLRVRMDYGVDAMTGLFEALNAQSWFYGNRRDTDSNSLLGGNTLGGQISQLSSLASWYLDSELTKVAPPFNRTGEAFAIEWERRKGNSINKEFAKSLSAVAVQNPLTRKYLLRFGRALHESFPLWLTYNAVTHFATLSANFWFMNRSGAWKYTES